jgi:RNA polymerase sigma factor (sigma-70 family)
MKVDDVAATTLDQTSVDGVAPDWEGIVAEHSARVYRLAYRLTGNRPDAEDLTQDVFIRVFRSLDTYEPGNFPGWLHRITTNLFLDRVRRKSRLRMDNFGEGAEERLLSQEVLPESAVHDANFDPDIEAALASLSDEFRVAVVLCDIEGLSYEEISDVLGIKLGTVRSRIHRGRTQLREHLAHRAPGKGRTRFVGPVGI